MGTGKYVYTEGEMSLFRPIWNSIPEESDIKRHIEKLRDQLLLMFDETSLLDGTSPLLPDLEREKRRLSDHARQLHPHLTDDDLGKLFFYALYHKGDSNEYDFDAEVNALLDRQGQDK
jgi:hypothetical protein